MANIFAIHSVGNSIVTFLRNSYAQMRASAATELPECGFDLVSSTQLTEEKNVGTRIALLLYRVTVNEHVRQSRSANVQSDGPAPLSLDLHFLLSAWGATPLDEQITFAWTLRQLHEHPVLDESSLSPEAGWSRDELIQIVPAELSVEDTMRIWDALEPSYRLSATYIARLVRLDPDQPREFRPVVARRLTHGGKVEEIAP